MEEREESFWQTWKRKFLGLLVLAGCLSLLIIGAKAGHSWYERGGTVYSTNTIAHQISEVSELATLRYRYRNAAKSEEDPYKLFGAINVPFTGKSMIVSYSGTIMIGTDLSKANISVDHVFNTIRVRLNPCKIISNEIDEESWEFWDMSSSIFNPLTPQDDSNLRKEQKAVMEQLVMDDGLIDEANVKACTQVEALLRVIYPEADIQVQVDQ